MRVYTKEIKITTDDPVTLIPLSDLHVGNIGFDEKKLKETVKWIADNDAYTILLGDMIDAITQKDPRHENDSIHPSFFDRLDNLPHEQTMDVVKLLEPIKDQIIATVQGNHEYSVKKHFSYDSALVLAQALDVPKMADPSVVRLKLRRTRTSTFNYDIWCSHGIFIGGGKMLGSKVNNLLKVSNGFHADAYMCGHSHQLFSTSDNYMVADQTGNMVTRRRVFMNTGSFQKTYDLPDGVDTWAARSGFPPGRTGTARLDIYLHRDRNTYKIKSYGRC